jgi:hypothetical protein
MSIIEQIRSFFSSFYWYWFLPIVIGQIALGFAASTHALQFTHTNFNLVVFSLILYNAGWFLNDYKGKRQTETE